MARSISDQVLYPIFGGDTSYEDAQAEKALEQAIEAYTGVDAPVLGDINYDQYDWLGDFQGQVDAPIISAGADIDFSNVSPELAQAFLAGDSAFNDVSVDPRLKTEQHATLEALREIADKGGLTMQDDARLNELMNTTAQADRGRREAIMQNMSARGMGGSGMDLLAQLQSSQAATDRANQSSLDIAAMAEQRELDALLRSGELASRMRGQDFDEQSRVAQANDYIDQFNSNILNQNEQWNTGTQNDMAMWNATNDYNAANNNRNINYDAQRFNAGNIFDANKANTAYDFNTWQEKQNLANANTDLANQEHYQNTFTNPQTQFTNDMSVAQGKATGYGMGADYWSGMGDREKVEAAEKMGAGGKAAQTYFSSKSGGSK